MNLAKKYILYLIRWQLSTPILAIVLNLLTDIPTIWATIIANLLGGLIFFWVDKIIFRKKSDVPLWEIKDEVKCVDCKKMGRGYRVVSWGKYDRSEDKNPKYRCRECSLKKMNQIKK